MTEIINNVRNVTNIATAIEREILPGNLYNDRGKVKHYGHSINFSGYRKIYMMTIVHRGS